jgi:hypothetical protein
MSTPMTTGPQLASGERLVSLAEAARRKPGGAAKHYRRIEDLGRLPSDFSRTRRPSKDRISQGRLSSMPVPARP